MMKQLGLRFLSALRGIGKFLLKILKNPKGRLGVILVGIVVLAAILAPVLTPYELDAYDIANGLAKPSREHLLGTDKNGIDILTQILYGARISLIIGIVTGLCVTLLGATLGVVSAYFGKVPATVILNLINVLLVIPTTPLMMIMSNLSSSYLMMIAIFTLIGWCGTARVVRAQVLSVMNMNYVRAAELSGGSKTYIMYRHILPAVSHLLIMNCALSCAGFMIAEAGLSFIGLGDPSVISWGKILVAAQDSAFTSGLWAWVLAPGVAIFITVYGFMQIGYALEEILNPKMKRKKDKRKNGLPPEEAAAQVFASMAEQSEDEALRLKEEFSKEVPTRERT
ncbi:MAG: ABC transporter permease [Clostridia bacterium]|nr:ABC transporter permease [Clostridia bacterium]MBQ8340516.1 ABC transporter permease [Clostridia bacterium]